MIQQARQLDSVGYRVLARAVQDRDAGKPFNLAGKPCPMFQHPRSLPATTESISGWTPKKGVFNLKSNIPGFNRPPKKQLSRTRISPYEEDSDNDPRSQAIVDSLGGTPNTARKRNNPSNSKVSISEISQTRLILNGEGSAG